MAARRRPDPLRRVEGEEGTRTPSLATPPVKSLELTPLDVFGQEDHSPLPEFDLELDSLVHMDDDGPVVSEAAVGRIAPSRRSNHFDETENMRIKRIAIRFCTVFGVMTVLGVLIGAFAFGVLGPPPRLHGVLLTKSCTLPAKRVMLSSSNGTTAGELLVPWPHHVFVPPFTGSVESMPRYFLAPTVDIHLLTEGVPMDVDMIALMANRIYLHCNTLNSLVDSGRTSHARTPDNTLSGEGFVIVSNIILSLAVKFGNGTPFAPGSPWFTTGAYHASPLPQFPQFEEYRLVVSSSPDLPATATARLLKACRAAVGVDVSHTHGRWLSGVTDSPAVTITSSSVWGIMRGLETLHQLVLPNGQIASAPIWIQDKPAFPWRGLLVDTSRHFIPVANVLGTLTAMSASKLNVLHWHITDAQSFPIALADAPALAAKGAWDSTKVYTTEDVQTIVSLATTLGIRIVPEIDVPAHTARWAAAYPNIIARCDQLAGNFSDIHLMDKYALNPIEEQTYIVLEAVFGDISKLFPDKYIHIGGDEFHFICWEQVPAIAAYMAEHQMNSLQLFRAFVDRLKSILQRVAPDKTIIVWQELYNGLYNDAVPNTTVVEVWRDWDGDPVKSTVNATAFNHSVIVAAYAYLDHEDGWRSYYGYSPLPPSYRITVDQQEFIWGGEAAIWAEHVTQYNFDCRVWPRGAAIAERLWTVDHLDVSEFYARMIAHANRLNGLGISSFTAPPALNVKIRTSKRNKTSTDFTASLQAGYTVNVLPAQIGTGSSALTEPAQCLTVDQRSQPALAPKFRSFLIWNIDNGGESRLDDILTYLRDSDFDTVGLIEMSGWIDDINFMNKMSYYSGSLSRRAGQAGYPYAAMLTAPSGYHMGILSRYPIEVLDRHVSDMERGFFAVRIASVVYVVTHMHAHEARLREVEAVVLINTITRLVGAAVPVVIMGDFNTLSPLDANCYTSEGLMDYLFNPNVPVRFRQKYLKVDRRTNGYLHEFDFSPMQTLLNSGFRDVVRMDMPRTDCVYTEPTPITDEQPMVNGQLPKLRLDYILANDAFLSRYDNLTCTVVADEQSVGYLSDHYPIACSWPQQL